MRQKFTPFILPILAKFVGFAIIFIGIILIIVKLLSGVHLNDFFNSNAELQIFGIYAILVLGEILVIFSKETTEDEYIKNIRLKSFSISVIIHAIYFFAFSFTSLTIGFINFPAVILINSLLLVYIVAYYIQRK